MYSTAFAILQNKHDAEDAVCFGTACAVTSHLLCRFLWSSASRADTYRGYFFKKPFGYELKNVYFGFCAIIFILVAGVAVAPPIIKMAKAQPSEEVENG